MKTWPSKRAQIMLDIMREAGRPLWPREILDRWNTRPRNPGKHAHGNGRKAAPNSAGLSSWLRRYARPVGDGRWVP